MARWVAPIAAPIKGDFLRVGVASRAGPQALEITMKLDSNRAWKEASRNVSRNRDPLAAVAGVFFMLPQLALSLFFPQPEPTAGMSEQQIVELVQGYYLSTLPVLIPMLLLQTLGTLALLSLLGHPSRPTVGGALKLSLANLPTYLGAQILLGLAIGLGGGLLVALLTLTGLRRWPSRVCCWSSSSRLVRACACRFLPRLSPSRASVARSGRCNARGS